MTWARPTRSLVGLLIPLAAAACGDAAGPSGPGLPESLAVLSGDAQEGTVGQPLADPIMIEVTDSSGTPIPDLVVTFTTAHGEVTPTSAATDHAGRVSTAWTLGTTAGEAALGVEAGGLDATIAATALPGAPAAVDAAAAEEQQAPPGGAVDESPAVVVSDEYGNAISGVTVLFEVTGGGGTVDREEAATDGAGRADAGSWTLGESRGIDTDTVVATVSGLEPVVFIASTVLTPEATTYASIEGDSYDRFAWAGEHIAFLTATDELDPLVMTRVVATFDSVYGYYAAATGREPGPHFTYEGRGTIAQVSSTCGAGCGFLGATGIELTDWAFDVLYDGLDQRDEYDQILFYEFGRNFWFYGAELAYKPPHDGGSTTTGYAVLMRFLSMEATGVTGGPFGALAFPEFRAAVEGLVDIYVADTDYTWENTLATGAGVSNDHGLGATDLFASKVMRLRRDYGGQHFIAALWRAVDARPVAESTQEAVDNFVIAASTAAGEDLAALFRDEWRWPVSDAAVAALGERFRR